MKDFLMTENKRNHDAHRIFERFLHRAIGECEVLVGHHIIFLQEGQEPNEIPSADCLCFSPELMGAVFGPERAKQIMLTLAHRVSEERDRVLADFLDALDLEDPEGALKKAAGAIAGTLTTLNVGGPA